jgi:hypothetical protein
MHGLMSIKMQRYCYWDFINSSVCQKYLYASDKLNQNKLSVKTQRIFNINLYNNKTP